MEDNVKIYRLNDDISFRQCDLFEEDKLKHGDCTNFAVNERNWEKYYHCEQNGIHLHCTKHPEIELEYIYNVYSSYLTCPKCKNQIEVNFQDTVKKCLRMLNMEQFKNATLIRLDDWYVPEIKQEIKAPSNYWMKADVKTDKDGDTIIVIYVGHKGDKEKCQFFIKPEKMQLTSDHKDLDPAKILSKIEVTFKDRTLTHKFDDKHD